MHLSSSFAKNDKKFVNRNEYKLKPKEFVLALTKEKITIPNTYAGLYDNYTYLARIGVMTHLGSMFVHPDVECQIRLEIFNASDHEVILKQGQRVGQIILFEVG